MRTEDIRSFLDMTAQSAFCVENNMITYTNQGAKALQISEGTCIFDLLLTGTEEYREFADGRLYLTLSVSGRSCVASVSKLWGADIFTLEQDSDQAELKTMALAAKELRNPLSSIMTIADSLFPVIGQDADPEVQLQISQINRGLFQMLRVIGNMSDAARYATEVPSRQEVRDVAAMMEEIFGKAAGLIRHGDLTLTYSGPKSPVYCSVDAEKLERAVYNVLSNAIKFTPKGGTIEAKLALKGSMLRLSVQDSGSGIPQELRDHVYTRFQRGPALEDGRFGIGLGMVLIRSTASAHGGTVLIDHPGQTGTRITMTMDVRRGTGTTLRSGLLRMDYAGEQDHSLIELSDILPPEAYN